MNSKKKQVLLLIVIEIQVFSIIAQPYLFLFCNLNNPKTSIRITWIVLNMLWYYQLMDWSPFCVAWMSRAWYTTTKISYETSQAGSPVKLIAPLSLMELTKHSCTNLCQLLLSRFQVCTQESCAKCCLVKFST